VADHRGGRRHPGPTGLGHRRHADLRIGAHRAMRMALVHEPDVSPFGAVPELVRIDRGLEFAAGLPAGGVARLRVEAAIPVARHVIVSSCGSRPSALMPLVVAASTSCRRTACWDSQRSDARPVEADRCTGPVLVDVCPGNRQPPGPFGVGRVCGRGASPLPRAATRGCGSAGGSRDEVAVEVGGGRSLGVGGAAGSGRPVTSGKVLGNLFCRGLRLVPVSRPSARIRGTRMSAAPCVSRAQALPRGVAGPGSWGAPAPVAPRAHPPPCPPLRDPPSVCFHMTVFAFSVYRADRVEHPSNKIDSSNSRGVHRLRSARHSSLRHGGGCIKSVRE
jgi:hypothetical protein